MQQPGAPAKRGLSREFIKYVAVFMMTLNHISNVFLYGKGTGHDALALFLVGLGCFTAPAMLYFMVDGIYYTRSMGKYALRMAVFAAVSQLPYTMAFSAPGRLRYYNLNFMVTLLICLVMLWAFRAADENAGMRPAVKAVLCGVMFISAVWLTRLCDWAYQAPVYAAAFFFARRLLKNIKLGWIFVLIANLAFSLRKVTENGPLTVNGAIFTVMVFIGPLLAAIVICAFYRGGRSKHSGAFSKWFFYAYYPAHLLILSGICYLIN